MWFLFGLVTTLGFLIGSLIWRLRSSWKGRQSDVQGFEYEWLLQEHRRSSDTLTIGVRGIESKRFRFKPESWWDKTLKDLGVSKEHQTGQALFDDNIYIASDDADITGLLSTDPKLTAAILDIFDSPSSPDTEVEEIRNSGGRIWVKYTVGNDFDPEHVNQLAQRVVAKFHGFVAAYRKSAAQGRPASRDPFILKAIALLAVSTGLLIGGFLQLFANGWQKIPFVVDSPELLRSSALIGIAIVLGLCVLAVILLKRSSRTHLVITELLLVGIFGATMSSYGFLNAANRDFDQSRPKRYDVKVLDKQVRRGRRGSRYRVYVVDWTRESKQRSFRVSKDFYDDTEVGARLLIRQREGYLGYRWVDQVERK